METTPLHAGVIYQLQTLLLLFSNTFLPAHKWAAGIRAEPWPRAPAWGPGSAWTAALARGTVGLGP